MAKSLTAAFLRECRGTADDFYHLRAALVHAVTAECDARDARDIKARRPTNGYAIGHMLGAVDGVIANARGRYRNGEGRPGLTPAQCVAERVSDHFTPAPWLTRFLRDIGYPGVPDGRAGVYHFPAPLSAS